jgi:hypothetical protein
MKIKIVKENQERTITQRKKPRPQIDNSFERTAPDDFEDFDDSFGEPAILKPLDKDDGESPENNLSPELMVAIKKAVEQELKNPEVLRAIAQLIKVR